MADDLVHDSDRSAINSREPEVLTDVMSHLATNQPTDQTRGARAASLATKLANLPEIMRTLLRHPNLFARLADNRVTRGSDATGWSAHERAALRATEALYGEAMISDAAWAILSKRLDEKLLIELAVVVGQYQAAAYCRN